MAIYAGPEIVNDGLVLHVDAANSRSYPGTGSVWYDLSGNGLDFNVVGSPTWNSAGYFTNFNDSNYFECSSSTGWTSVMPTGDSPRTVCALVRRVTGVTFEHVIMWGDPTSGASY